MNSDCTLYGSPVPRADLLASYQLASEAVPAGFPSPAEEFAGERVDLERILNAHPQSTYFQRVKGYSMLSYGISDGDFIFVDRALATNARHGQIVVAILDNEFTLKCLHKLAGQVRLKAGNSTYPDIVPKSDQTLEIWGVVIASLKLFPK